MLSRLIVVLLVLEWVFQSHAQNTMAFVAQPIRTSDGRCLSVPTTLLDKQPIQVVACDGSSKQHWDGMTSGPHIQDAGFVLLVASGSSMCLDVTGFGDSPGTYECGGRTDGGGGQSSKQAFTYTILGRDTSPFVFIPREDFMNNGQGPGQGCLTVAQSGLTVSSCDQATPSSQQLFYIGSPPPSTNHPSSAQPAPGGQPASGGQPQQPSSGTLPSTGTPLLSNNQSFANTQQSSTTQTSNNTNSNSTNQPSSGTHSPSTTEIVDLKSSSSNQPTSSTGQPPSSSQPTNNLKRPSKILTTIVPIVVVIVLLFLVVLIWYCRRPKSNLERNKKNIRYGMLSPIPFMSAPINDGSSWRPTEEKGSRIAETVQPPEPSFANAASSTNSPIRPTEFRSSETQERPRPSSPPQSSMPFTTPPAGKGAPPAIDSNPFPINTTMTSPPPAPRAVPVLLSAHIDLSELLAHLNGGNQPDEQLPSY